jgi:hypothetical protein
MCPSAPEPVTSDQRAETAKTWHESRVKSRADVGFLWDGCVGTAVYGDAVAPEKSPGSSRHFPRPRHHSLPTP